MIEVDELPASEWKKYAETAHAVCFREHKPAEWDRIDFTLVGRKQDQLLGFVTCREIDAHTLYFQFGGAFPGTRGTSVSWKVYQAFIAHCKPRYKRITQLVENTNVTMLKMAALLGYKIVGIRTYGGTVLLEHLLELQS